ncbi:AAC-rich mRNA clone AAC4 protein-like [Tubulanus polymorphus]|uniref:AAC-rich mRNA clone AAC4 protein-like n=1 Tax=Tubulanus polymorphus TaxID=672921 RepID=UPI003DA47F88
MRLSAAALKLRDEPNAGGNSVVSEVLSYELLAKCFGARLQKTEMEVSYFPLGGAMTDYTCRIQETALGVSVTRALRYRADFDEQDAERLLNKKLQGVIKSSATAQEKWSKQILHVWATSQRVAELLRTAYRDRVSMETKSNTVVLVTVTESEISNEIFFDRFKRMLPHVLTLFRRLVMKGKDTQARRSTETTAINHEDIFWKMCNKLLTAMHAGVLWNVTNTSRPKHLRRKFNQNKSLAIRTNASVMAITEKYTQ